MYHDYGNIAKLVTLLQHFSDLEFSNAQRCYKKCSLLTQGEIWWDRISTLCLRGHCLSWMFFGDLTSAIFLVHSECTIWTVRFCWFFVLVHCRYSYITNAYWKIGRRNHSQYDWKLFAWYGKSLQTCTSKTRAPFDDDLCDDGRSVHSPCGGHYMLFPDGPGVFEPHEFEARSVHAVPTAGGAWQSSRRKSCSIKNHVSYL